MWRKRPRVQHPLVSLSGRPARVLCPYSPFHGLIVRPAQMRYCVLIVIGLFKRPPSPSPLGRLEQGVMDIVWSRGESNVRDVAEKLTRPLAYTTVMTTLDRLFKKGLLERRKAERAFLYSPRLSRKDWECQRAGELISCFLDNVDHHPALLDELERKIKLKRKELDRRNS